MATIEGDVEVGCLCLRRQPGGWPTALDVDHEHRQLDRDRQRHGFALEGETWAAGCGNSKVSRKCCAEGHACGGDLVLCLNRPYSEVLVLRQFVEDVASGRDRIRPERDGQLGQLTRSDQPPGERRVAGNTRVFASGQVGGAHLVSVPNGLGRLAVIEPGGERRFVGGGDQLVLTEPFADPFDGRLDRPGVHERHKTEGEEVLGSLGVTRLDPKRLAGGFGDRGHRDSDYAVPGDRAVVERIRRVISFLEVALVEGVLVHDQRATRLQPMEVCLECGRVHSNEHVRFVARSRDVVIRDMDLETRHPVDRSRRCPNLGREVRHRLQVIPE